MKCTGIAFLIVSMTCQAEEPKVIDSFCQRAQIIRPAREDTAETKRQVLLHNEKVKRCPVSSASRPKAPIGREIESPAAKPKKRNFSRYAVSP